MRIFYRGIAHNPAIPAGEVRPHVPGFLSAEL